MLKAIIFDFDGVICESVGIKAEAFRQLFLDYPEHLEKIVDFHMANGGMSRYFKFEVIYRDILKKELLPAKSRELGDLYTKYSLEGVVKAPLVKGAHDFLKKYHQQLGLFIVSGTPEEEMHLIVREKGLTAYFRQVYGSPRMKGELTKLILQENRLQKDEVLFVGDSINDYDGAKEAGVRFIGRVHASYENPFAALNLAATITDLAELEAVISEQCLEEKHF